MSLSKAEIAQLVDLDRNIFTEPSYNELQLKDTCLQECRCPSHSRFIGGNTRTKTENLIVDHVIRHYSPDQQINVLSLACGKFLQDVILLIRWIKVGFTKFSLTMIDPDEGCENAYRDFTTVIHQLSAHYQTLGISLEIKHRYFRSISEKAVGETRYNIVYAIDFEYYYSLQDIKELRNDRGEGVKIFFKNNYKPPMDLLKAFNLCDEQSAPPLVIASHGDDIICLTDNKLSSLTTYRPLSSFFPDSVTIDAFYINSNIFSLLQNLEFLKQRGRPLIINIQILFDEDRSAVRKFMEKVGITSFFVNTEQEKEIIPLNENSLIIVVDYSPLEDGIGEQLANVIPPELSKRNICTIRFNHSTEAKRENLPVSQRFMLFPPLEHANVTRIVSKERNKFRARDTDEQVLHRSAETLREEVMQHLLPDNGYLSLFSNLKKMNELSKKLKKNYLEILAGLLASMDENQKIEFAYYLMKFENHILKYERDFFVWRDHSFSNQTESLYKAVKMLLGDKFVLEDGKIYINDCLANFQRHHPELGFLRR